MSAIREIREFTGLSHTKLAQWFGVSKSLVQFAETGERSLPAGASQKVYAMLMLIQQLEKEAASTGRPAAVAVSDPGKLAALHKKKEDGHRRSALALQDRLRKLKTKHPRLEARLALFDALNNRPPEWYRADDRDKSWRELTEWFSRDRMSFTGLEQQELLQDKIEMHLAYAKLHRERWERYEGMASL